MLDVLDQDYIRNAYTKGLSKKTVVFRHAMQNVLNLVITTITGWFTELLAGAFFVDYIFGWEVIGKVTADALEKLDFPVVMESVLADVLYGVVDPKIRVKQTIKKKTEEAGNWDRE